MHDPFVIRFICGSILFAIVVFFIVFYYDVSQEK